MIHTYIHILYIHKYSSIHSYIHTSTLQHKYWLIYMHVLWLCMQACMYVSICIPTPPLAHISHFLPRSVERLAKVCKSCNKSKKRKQKEKLGLTAQVVALKLVFLPPSEPLSLQVFCLFVCLSLFPTLSVSASWGSQLLAFDMFVLFEWKLF